MNKRTRLILLLCILLVFYSNIPGFFLVRANRSLDSPALASLAYTISSAVFQVNPLPYQQAILAESARMAQQRQGLDLDTKPSASNQKLQNIINNLYKGQSNPQRIGNGTTMDAIRNELKTGEPTGGKFHYQKGQESIQGLNNLLDKGNLGTEDACIAQALVEDLENALQGR